MKERACTTKLIADFPPTRYLDLPQKTYTQYTLGQKPTFYPEILVILIFQKCEFCEKWDFRIVNFVKKKKKWYFRIVNFVKIEILEMWILWKMRFQKGEFCKNWDFQYVNFWIFAPELRPKNKCSKKNTWKISRLLTIEQIWPSRTCSPLWGQWGWSVKSSH